MNMSEHTQILHSGLRGEMRRDESMARHVSWRAGGRARCTYAPADLRDLALFLRGLPEREPVLMVGLGSNLLVRDGGLDATVIFTHWALRGLRLLRQDAMGGELWAQAGVASPKIARFAALHSLGEAEFFSGIPGTLGGALAMNAGCYGGETWNAVTRVETIDRAGNIHVRTPQDYAIGYRSVERCSHAVADVLSSDNGLSQRRCVCRPATAPWHGTVSRRCWRGVLLRSRWVSPTPARCSAIRRAIMPRV